jgi:RNA polymerase sigma-70 factor (ECF subfamily)
VYLVKRKLGSYTLVKRIIAFTLLYDDDILIAGCLRQERHAQRALYDKYRTPLYRLCLRYARDAQEAEDFLHESFLLIFRDLGQLRQPAALPAWLRRLTINTCLQLLRKRPDWFAMDERRAEVLADTAADEDDNSLLDIPIQSLLEAIQSLPDGYRTVFNLFVVDGFSHQDIAAQLDISVGASKSQLHKAKALLRKKIQLLGHLTPTTN